MSLDTRFVLMYLLMNEIITKY